jgi:biopolymer transport protein ExbD
MSMSVGSGGESNPMMDINTTPLIDVMLVLLIMLIITLPPLTHAVSMDMPTGKPPEQLVEPEVIELVIDFDGTILWNNNEVAFGPQLQAYFLDAARKEPQPELHLRPNPLAKYDVVAKVLALAQRSGVKRIGFVGNERFG